jgi:mono/diheme cytochrome c family protein
MTSLSRPQSILKYFAVFVLFAVAAVMLSACGSTATQVAPNGGNNPVATLESSSVDAGATGQTPVAESTPVSEAASVAGISFSKEIMPIFEASCVNCHGVEKINRGLDLTSYDKLMAGSVKGAVIVAGNADNSTLFQQVAQKKMPKRGSKLTDEQVNIIKEWINGGALNN